MKSSQVTVGPGECRAAQREDFRLGDGVVPVSGNVVRMLRVVPNLRELASGLGLFLRGRPRSTAMAMVGHKTESIYRRYAIVDEVMLREGGAKLAAYAATDRP